MTRSKLFALFTLLSAALSLCSGAAIYPKSLTTQSGSVSTSNLNALKTRDQSGNQDTWNNYVEIYGSSSAYKGVFAFDVSSVAADSVCFYGLTVNFKGPKANEQTWQFEWLNQATGAWVAAGDNTNVEDWKWSEITMDGTEDFSSLVKDGELQVRLSSKTKGDDCDIDYLELDVTSTTSDSAPTTAPTQNPATAAPTQTPATSAPTERPTSAPTSAPTQRPTSAPTERPTQRPTERPTERPTQRPTEHATQRPTSAPTERPTQRPTEHATQRPTSTPTEKPTRAPTTRPTQAPTAKATSAPTSRPTQAPTAKATSAPTAKATSAPTAKATSAPSRPTSGKLCAAGTHYRPGPKTTWQWQLSGNSIDTSVDVQMYDIDMFDNSASLIQTLHSQGRAVTCYIDTAYEPGRPDSSSFTSAVLGSGIDGWPGQKWVDIRSTVVRNIMANRIAQAAAKGCDAVEMDDVDSYTNNPGFPLTAADQLDFNSFLATTAHANDLGIALKNDLDQVTALASKFDFAINEQCFQYDECDDLSTFISQGKAVFGVEYELSTSQFCSKANTDQFSWLKKDLDLDASLTECCPTCTGTYTCVAANAARSFEEDEPLAEAEAVNVVLAQEEPEFHSAAAQVSGIACLAVIALFVALL